MSESPLRWAAVGGRFTFSPTEVTFHGGKVTLKGPDREQEAVGIGIAISNARFAGGLLSAEVTFDNPVPESACDLVFYYNPATHAYMGAGISNEVLYSIKLYDTRWQPYVLMGEPNRLEADRPYHLECRVRGSLVRLLSEGVEVITHNLPVALPQSQVGIWCRSTADIHIRNFTVTAEEPTAFVVMQFTAPFNQLFDEVIRPICQERGVRAVRADDTYGPGLIIADVVRQIDESKLVIAEISPVNANVYYEVGYAHARGKPTILIADRSIERLRSMCPRFAPCFTRTQSTVREGSKRACEDI